MNPDPVEAYVAGGFFSVGGLGAYLTRKWSAYAIIEMNKSFGMDLEHQRSILEVIMGLVGIVFFCIGVSLVLWRLFH